MTITEYMKSNLLFLDGGMGALLQKRGLKSSEKGELWNLTNPEAVKAIHREYYDAGSNAVLTNTFGANPLKFDSETLEKLIPAAVKNAREAAAESAGTQEKFVALDIGPCGKLLKPYGELEFEDAVNAFKQVARIGAAAGVDFVMIETMSDSYETKAALLGVKEACDLPVFVSNAYGEDGKLLTGADAAAMAALLGGMGAAALGANCSLGPKQLFPVIDRLLDTADVPVLFKPNAGLPKVVDGETVYDVTPEEFAEAVCEEIGKGVRIAGGCCGTTPEYIAALVKRAQGIVAEKRNPERRTVISSYTHAVEFGKNPVLIGERINPTGKKLFKQALKNRDIDYILNEGIKQQNAGVHALDVNVGMPGIDEKQMLTDVVKALQAVSDLPLQIDTTNIEAMEQAVRLYNGKPLINSVNGKQESMAAIFPIVKKYGGCVIALTLDEDGIPTNAEGRVAIAKKIIDEAEKYGISKNELIFDPLAMAVSADSNSANVTLESVRRISKELGCCTSLGVSNISFGLPGRDSLNSVFFASALTNGLSAAIMNPYSKAMLDVYKAHRALYGLDENCADYIAYCAENDPQTPAAKPVETALTAVDAIVQGRGEKAAALTAELLKSGVPALDIIRDKIVPALDIIGRDYEKKKAFLPQLLMSAEAAKAAFDEIKKAASKTETGNGITFVLATVEGDIHDIGKNIVRLLLENYGFDVIDLGKDVKPEVIVKTVTKTHAPLLGLSALMTTTVPAMEKTIKLIREAAPWCRIVVGGAVLTESYAESIGADKYAADAMDTVRYAQSI